MIHGSAWAGRELVFVGIARVASGKLQKMLGLAPRKQIAHLQKVMRGESVSLYGDYGRLITSAQRDVSKIVIFERWTYLFRETQNGLSLITVLRTPESLDEKDQSGRRRSQRGARQASKRPSR